MSYLDWMIKGPKFTSCNCDYGCPCEFNAPPTYGKCQGIEAMAIEEGYFGDVRLDGLRFGTTYRWPGPMHLGGGDCQAFIDESAGAAQREALISILSGEEQAPNTAFNIYGSTMAREYDLVYAPIEFACDLEARTARFAVPGYLDLAIEPIRNPVTGAIQRIQVHQLDGFEFRVAEMGSGTFATTGGEIALDEKDRFAAIAYVAYGPEGLID